jgi:hypothetical protein
VVNTPLHDFMLEPEFAVNQRRSRIPYYGFWS